MATNPPSRILVGRITFISTNMLTYSCAVVVALRDIDNEYLQTIRKRFVFGKDSSVFAKCIHNKSPEISPEIKSSEDLSRQKKNGFLALANLNPFRRR